MRFTLCSESTAPWCDGLKINKVKSLRVKYGRFNQRKMISTILELTPPPANPALVHSSSASETYKAFSITRDWHDLISASTRISYCLLNS